VAKSSKNAKAKTVSEATTKGKLVELIVANLHKVEGVRVEQNVKIPPKYGSPKRRREIDVLIHSHVAGYPFKIAIECKNYKKVIGVGMIDEFRGKLEEAGLSPQQGIYVTTRRFTKDAVDRAQILGIRLLLLSGLSADRLTSEILKAVHSVIYLLAGLTRVEIKTDIVNTEDVPQLEDTGPMMFCNAQGEANGAVPHEVWVRWFASQLPTEIGDHVIDMPISDDWFFVKDHKLEKVLSINITLHVAAHVVDFEGQATVHALWNQPNNTLSRFNGNVSITLQNGTKPLGVFHTEESLQDYLKTLAHPVKSAERVLLPRIWFNWCYWPPSLRMENIIEQRKQDFLSGKIGDFEPENQNEYEGTDLSTVWEPVSPNYFTFVGHDEPEN
jgi:hypothetical protein